MVHVGIIGCGNIGKVHAELLSEMEGISLDAFADIRIERANDYCKRFTDGTSRAYASMSEMLTKENLDVVHICTPHNCHVPQAVMALQQGISVFMEKPPAISRPQFAELKEAEAKSQARLGICFQNRYNATTERISQILDEGTLGKVKGGRAFVTWNRNKPYYTESGWRGKLSTEGGGVLINQSIHTLDLLLLWFGKPLHVEASTCNHHLKGIIEVEDTMEAYLVFSEGEEPVAVSFFATTAYCQDASVLFDIVCEHGRIRLEGDTVWYQEENKDPRVWQEQEGETLGKDYWGSGHEACIRDFYESMRTGEEYRNNLASCECSFETMIELYESAKEKEIKWIR